MTGKKGVFFAVLILMISGWTVGSNFIKEEYSMNVSSELNLASLFVKNNTINSVDNELFDKLMLKLMDIAHMSSLSAAIIRDNEIEWTKGYGLYDRERNKYADKNTIYKP